MFSGSYLLFLCHIIVFMLQIYGKFVKKAMILRFFVLHIIYYILNMYAYMTTFH